MVRIHFASGSYVDLEMTMAEIRNDLSESGWTEFPQDRVLVVWGHVTHLQDLDPPAPPTAEVFG